MRFIVILLISSLFFSCGPEKELYLSTSFREPATDGLKYIYSEDGLHWDSIPGIWLKPSVGNQQVLRDPSIVRSPEGVYHLVWTSSWKGDKGFGYASSTDLIHWTEPRMINVMEHEPTTVNVWAPELFYDDEKGQYLIIWASCIPGRYDLGEEDVTNNHRLFYTTTRDFTTFSDTRLFFDPGFSSIDATLVKRAPGDYVMVFKDNTRPNRNLKVAFAPSAEGPYTGVSEAFSDSFCEGPTVAALGNRYVIYFDEYRRFSYGAVTTTDFTNFSYSGNEVTFPKGHKHGTVVKVPESVVKNLIKKASE